MADSDLDAWALPTPHPAGPAPATAPVASNPDIDQWALPAPRPVNPAATAIRNNLAQALPVNPDQQAQSLRLATAAGVPVQTAANMPQVVQQQAAQASFDADRLTQQFPHLAQFMQNADNVKLMHDDIPATANVEQHVAALGVPPAPPTPAQPAVGDSWMSTIGSGAAAAAKYLFSADGKGLLYDAGSALSGLGSSFNAAGKAASLALAPAPMLYDAIMGGTKAQDAYFGATTARLDADSPALDVPKDATFGAKAFHSAGQLLGALSQITLSGGGGAPEAAATDFAPQVQSAGQAVTGAVEHGLKSMAFPAVSDAINTGKKVYEETGDAGMAARAAIAQWGSSSAMGVVPLSAAGSLGTRLATGAVSGAASGELSRQWMNNFLPQGDQQGFDPESTILSALSGAIMGGVMGPRDEHAALAPLLTDHFQQMEQATQAEQNAQVLGGLAQASAASKLRDRAPDTFSQFVADAAEAGPVQNVYVDGKVLADALHQSGIGTDELNDKMPGLETKLTEALATGGQVEIPVEDFATHIAGGALEQKLLPELRTDPEGMSLNEAQAFHQSAADDMKADAQRIDQARATDAPYQQSKQAVFDNIHGQLEATGRFTPDVSDAYAALHRDFYSTMADRMGVLPHEVLEQHPVQIGAEQPPGQALAQSPRAFYDPNSKTIAILKDADLSSFLHESGHHFLDSLSNMAARPDAPEDIKSDMGAVLKQFGVPDLDTWHGMSLDEQRAGHEQFAQGFERYLLDGKAPSFELRSLFGKFRSWLLNIYQSLKGLNVELSPEVRGVFDRMLASRDAIQQAEQARAYMPLFDTPEKAAKVGVSPEDWTKYQALGKEATDAAIDSLSSKTLRDLAWSDRARSAALKDLARDAAGKRRDTMAEVTAEVDKQPVYQAQRFLKRGETAGPDGEVHTTENHRLDIAALREMYPGDDGWQKLGYGKYGMLGENGLHPDLAADALGYPSGDALVRALLGAEPRREVIRQATEQRMLERHGDIATPQALAQAADDAVHNQIRTRFIATELKALNKAVGPAADLARAAKEVAEGTIASKAVRDINPRLFEAAETRAGKDSAKRLAAGDTAGAAVAKREQLLNNALARAARDAQTTIDKGLTYLKRFGKDSIRSKIDVDVRDQIDALLERFDLRQNPTEGPTRAQQSLQQWIEAQQAAGFAPAVPLDLLDPVVHQHFKDMPVERFTGLVDSVKALEHIGKERHVLTIDGKKVDRDDYVLNRLVPKMMERGERFTKDELVERPEDRLTNEVAIVLDHFKSWMRAAAAQLKPQEFKRNQYDRHEILGPFGESITDPTMNANYRKTEMLKGLSTDFQKAADELGRKWQDSLRDSVTNTLLADPDRSTPGETVPLRMTRGRMIGIAIHVGNESNFAKLTKGWGWDGGDVWRFLHENMTADDWKATQTVWDLYDKHWPDMEAMNRRLGNTMPDRIEPRAFQTKFGEQRGGYAAIKYDPLRSRRGEKETSSEAINPAKGLFGRDYYRPDTTTNGSMNARIEGYNDRVDLDFHTIARTLQDSIHDLAYRETLINNQKVIEHPKFRAAFKSAYGPEAYRSLQDWNGQLANSNNMDRATGALGRFLQYTRTGMVVNAIAFRATTVLKHGGSAGIKTTGYFLGGGEKFLASRMASMGTDYTNQIEGAKAKFGEIANRLMQQDRDYRATASTLFEPDSKLAKAHRFGHAAVAWSDMMTAVPTAWAAYDRAITEGIPKSQGGSGEPMTEAQAVNYANKIVREAHGSTAEASRSLVLNNSSEAMKMFTTLYGFMNNSYGQQLDAFDKLRTGGISNSTVLARSFMAIIVPAIWAAYLTKGGAKDDEGWGPWIAKAVGGEVASSVPFVRDAVAMVEGFSHAGMVSAENWLQTMVSAGKDIYSASTGEGKGKPVRDIANAVGTGLHIPGMGQLGTSAQYMADVQSGKEEPQNKLEYAQGVVTGHGPKH